MDDELSVFMNSDFFLKDKKYNNKNAILLCFDETYYIKYAKFCLYSIIHNTTDEIIFVRGVNLTQDTVEHIQSLNNRIDIYNYHYTMSYSIYDFCAQIRTKFIADEIIRYDIKQLLYLDADSIVRLPLQPIWNFLGDNDISCRCRHTNHKKNHFTAGVILFKNNDNIKKFVRKWHSETWKKVKFYQDQIGLFNVLTSDWSVQHISYKELTRIYWETGRLQNAIIFCPFGKGKTAPWFLYEQEKYKSLYEV